MRTLPALMAAATVLSLCGSVGAQDKPREGFFVHGALGTAYHTDSPSIDPFWPFWVHFDVRVGYAVDNHLAFVLEGMGNAVYGTERLPLSDDDIFVAGNVFQHGIGAQYYLLEGAFTPYLKSGVAIAWAIRGDPVEDRVIAGAGLGASFAGGLDMRVTPALSVTTEVQWIYHGGHEFAGNVVAGQVGITIYD